MDENFIFRNNDFSELYNKFETIRITKCICCNSQNFNNWTSFNGFSTDICEDCNLIFMNPQLDKFGLDEFYTNYIGETRLNNIKKMEQRSIQYKIDTDVLLKFITKGKILDVGCSGGYFLKNIPDSFEKFGTELDPFAFKLLKTNLNINKDNFYLGDINTCPFEKSSFDVLSMRGVIEHVPDPEETIGKVSDLIKTGGFFYICATPNGGSFSADLYKQNWNLYHPIEHLWHFSSKNLSLICERYNLKLIWEEYAYLGTPYENVNEDIKLINEKIEQNKLGKTTKNISPPFFENMMSLVFQKK